MTKHVRALCASAVFCAAGLGAAYADTAPNTIAAGTRLRFHLLAPVSSSESKSGQSLSFALTEPLVVEGKTLAPAGTVGAGTLLLAGHAGGGGHEGDLTLRLDTLPTADKKVVAFADQRIEINGKNAKIISRILGFTPKVGLAAHFIRGNEIGIDPDRTIETILTKDATIGAAAK